MRGVPGGSPGLQTGIESGACTARDRLRDGWSHGVSWEPKIILYKLSPGRGETGGHFLCLGCIKAHTFTNEVIDKCKETYQNLYL